MLKCKTIVLKFATTRALVKQLAANFVPESVYDNLVSAVRKHLPLLHRYLDLRSKILGISDLKMYDVYTTIVC